ncbi:MAG TPA: DUF1961 family protein [Phycisphaerae bacterium]|nr:DUF1961 family protein [Phycisphaerae bacterium]HRR85679.1 DUF1961 family protein [Phycisphaerae bacterium]
MQTIALSLKMPLVRCCKRIAASRGRDSRRAGLLVVCVATGLSALSCASPSRRADLVTPTARPNFVLILVDDLGWAELGCYGNRFNETPHLDRLANRGVQFTNAYAAAPVCSPTRAALMTGQYPARVGITDYLRADDERFLSPEYHTLAEALRDAGYATGLLGKWHLTGDYRLKRGEPSLHGFDEVICSETRYIGAGSYFAPYLFMPEVTGPRGEYLTDRLNREAVDFIRRHKDRPFFLYLSHYSVHTVLAAKPEMIEHFAAKRGVGKTRNNPVLAAMLASIDEGVGNITSALDELGIADRTVLIFASDNGGERRVTSNAPLRGGKSQLYEGGIRVPLIIYRPGSRRAGKTCNVPVITPDLYPTLIEMAGLKNRPNRMIDGESIVGLLDGDRTLQRDSLYWHYPLDRPHFLGGMSAGAIRQGNYKLIEFFDNGKVELYDLKTDLRERENLAHRMPEKAAQLRAQLARWRASVGAVVPNSAPATAPSTFQGKTRPSGQAPAPSPRPHLFSPPSPGDSRAPDGSPATSQSFSATLPASLLDDRGTLVMWFKPDKLLRGAGPTLSLLESDAVNVQLLCTDPSVTLDTRWGSVMTGTPQTGESRPYVFQTLLTHLKADRWYLATWTWNTADASRNEFFLDGVRQENASPFNYPGQFRAAGRDVTLTVGGPGLIVSAVGLYEEPISEESIKAHCEAAGHTPYTDEGVRFTGEKFIPVDVDWEHPLYSTSFEDPSELKDWRLEGGRSMTAANGKLVLESNGESTRSESAANHLVCWLDREVPADFLLEFAVRPENRNRGLNIVFFNARGCNGENIFEPPIKPRNGTFSQYHSGDLNNYHISYWSGGRGTSNLRKNRGFRLAAIGKDLVTPAPQDAFQVVRIYKRGGQIRLTIDDVLSLSYDDDGKTYGPIHAHSGWIGLRQMAHTQRCEYDYVRIYVLKTPSP